MRYRGEVTAAPLASRCRAACWECRNLRVLVEFPSSPLSSHKLHTYNYSNNIVNSRLPLPTSSINRPCSHLRWFSHFQPFSRKKRWRTWPFPWIWLNLLSPRARSTLSQAVSCFFLAEWLNGWMAEWLNGWMAEWLNGWKDRRETLKSRHRCCWRKSCTFFWILICSLSSSFPFGRNGRKPDICKQKTK